MSRSVSEQQLAHAQALLGDGDVVAFPTETVYGLGANAYNQMAVEKIFSIKNRPAHNPLIAHISSLDHLGLVTTDQVIEELIPILKELSPFIPGPLSIVIPRNEKICSAVSAGLETVAVRVPNHPVAHALLERCPFPLAAPSANPSNYVSPTSAEHVMAQLGNKIPLVLDGGECAVGIESTILDLSGKSPRILRQGIISAEILSEHLSVPMETLLSPNFDQRQRSPLAPGMLKEHYSPITPLKVLQPADSNQFPENSGLITMHTFSPLLQLPGLRHKRSLSVNGELSEICHNLFKTLREFDSVGLDVVYIEPCERTGIGRAIMDRIDRASAKWAGK